MNMMGTFLKVPALLILGVVADHCGRKPVVTLGVGCMAITFALLATNRLVFGGTTLYLVAVAQGLQVREFALQALFRERCILAL